MSVNKVILVGNVGKDPEVKYLDSGVKIAKFSLATTESYKNKEGEKVVNTEWHNIVAWRHLADLVEGYITKGKQLYIEGKILTTTWEDANGIKRYNTDILASSIQMLGRKSDGGNEDNKPANQPDEADDDLPF